jgi:hypothetical protein
VFDALMNVEVEIAITILENVLAEFRRAQQDVLSADAIKET